MSETRPATTGSDPAPITDGPPRTLPRSLIVAGFAILLLSYLLNAMDRQVFFPILPDIRAEYGFSLAEGGTLATGFTLGMAVAGLPTGYLLDRYSRKTVLLVSIVIFSLGTLATPLSAGFADMAAYRVISGFGEGMQSAALFAAVGAYFFHRRTFALGCTAAAYGTGIFLGPLVGIHFANTFDSWRAPFVLFGASGLIIAVITALVVRRSLTERRADQAVVTTVTYDYMPVSPYNRNSIALAVSSGISGLVVYGFLGLYPTFLINHLHYTATQAALASSFVGFGGMLAPLSGWLGDRVNQRNLLIVTYLALSATSLLVYQTRVTLGWECLFAFLMGLFSTGALYTNHNSALQRAVRPDQVGRAAGLFITSYYISSAFSGLLFAALVNHLGWSHAGLWQVTLLPLLAIVALTFARSSLFITAAKQQEA
ncbi:MFS transporter [Streptomyces sp. NPDC006355]|uniref:MFS transporter n=1 Tax=Streptomyces sp. NPDC006355 TaxID=3156758 RepID=UPI0033BA412D